MIFKINFCIISFQLLFIFQYLFSENFILKNTKKEFTPNTSRIEAFSDGVFLQLLWHFFVLELRFRIFRENFTTHDVLSELFHLSPKFISFALSFLCACNIILSSSSLFHSIEKARAFCGTIIISCSGFHSSVSNCIIGEYPLDMILVMFYGTILFMASLSFNLMLRTCVKQKLFYSTVSNEVLKQGIRRGKNRSFDLFYFCYRRHLYLFTFLLQFSW